MRTTVRYTLTSLRGQILGWGLGVAALGLILVPFYDVFMGKQADFMQMIENYPPEFLAFFGGDAAALSTAAGYLGMYGFSMLPVIVGIFAVIVGSGLLASDEESGRLDLIVAHPVSRAALFWGRTLAFVITSLGIMILGWLGFTILLGRSSLGVTWGQMALPFLPLLAQTLIYGALALLLSMLLPARRLAAMGTGIVLVASYFLSSMAGMNESLSAVARFLPYDYFQGGDALNGLQWAPFLGLLGASAVLALLAWRRFERRDIRVGGEGGWRLPSLPFTRRSRAMGEA
ncbi:MAG TPA: ABC transporter permease subunit [Anaerolineae bacterium]|nr:ABC transporter permease subunit [Anaerolineae bacterium]